MAKIKATHLNSEESATYKPTQYGVYPKDLIVDDDKKAKLMDLSEQVRTILRMTSNLRRTYEVLHDLQKRINGETAFHRNDTSEHAMFSYAAMLYGACFVRGAGGKRPIDIFDSSLRDNEDHKSFMVYRDKLFGHLDDNHDVRTDELTWVFLIRENELRPSMGTLMGGRITMISVEEINKWKMFAISIAESMWHHNNGLTKEINELLGNLTIEG